MNIPSLPTTYHTVSLICIPFWCLWHDFSKYWEQYMVPLLRNSVFNMYNTNMLSVCQSLGRIISERSILYMRVVIVVADKATLVQFNNWKRLHYPHVKMELFVLYICASPLFTSINILNCDMKVFCIQKYMMENQFQKLVRVWGNYAITFSRPGACLIPETECGQWLTFKSELDGVWVYFGEEEAALEGLNLKRNFDTEFYPLNFNRKILDVEILDTIFQQWEEMSQEMESTLAIMKMMYMTMNTKSERIEQRLNKIATHILLFKYQVEFKMAQAVLNTSIFGSKGKYIQQVLLSKGHRNEDFQTDLIEFCHVLKREGKAIATLDNEDRCSITMSSTVMDLQDPEFFERGFKDKFDFLRQITMSGIGVYAPINDAMLINPWSFAIGNILQYPYSIISQVAMEDCVQSGAQMGVHNIIRPVNHEGYTYNDTRYGYNSIIPIFSPQAACVMKPLTATKLYTMCVTFAILKTPHLVDENIHFAALGVLWLHTIAREESQKITSQIEATARLYLDNYSEYSEMLRVEPARALLTCNSQTLVKPIFVLQLVRGREGYDIYGICRLLIIEYLGRCLNKQTFPFDYFFLPTTRVRIDNLEQHMLGNLFHKLNKLRNLTSAGDMTLSTLRVAISYLLPPNKVKCLFYPKRLLVYIVHVLRYHTSGNRLFKPIPLYRNAMKIIYKSIVT